MPLTHGSGSIKVNVIRYSTATLITPNDAVFMDQNEVVSGEGTLVLARITERHTLTTMMTLRV